MSTRYSLKELRRSVDIVAAETRGRKAFPHFLRGEAPTVERGHLFSSPTRGTLPGEPLGKYCHSIRTAAARVVGNRITLLAYKACPHLESR